MVVNSIVLFFRHFLWDWGANPIPNPQPGRPRSLSLSLSRNSLLNCPGCQTLPVPTLPPPLTHIRPATTTRRRHHLGGSPIL